MRICISALYTSFDVCKSACRYAAIVWSGGGRVNGHAVGATEALRKEFLVAPGTPLEIECTSATPLLIYSVFPFTA